MLNWSVTSEENTAQVNSDRKDPADDSFYSFFFFLSFFILFFYLLVYFFFLDTSIVVDYRSMLTTEPRTGSIPQYLLDMLVSLVSPAEHDDSAERSRGPETASLGSCDWPGQ